MFLDKCLDAKCRWKGGLESAAQTHLAVQNRCALCTQPTSDRICESVPQVRARIFPRFPRHLSRNTLLVNYYVIHRPNFLISNISPSLRWGQALSKSGLRTRFLTDLGRLVSLIFMVTLTHDTRSSLNYALLLWWQWKPVRKEDHLDCGCFSKKAECLWRPCTHL